MTEAVRALECTPRVRRRILFRGRVQGVGFRPFIYRRALALGLDGWVRNSAQGVVVEAEGAPERISTLIEGAPPNAAIERIETLDVPPTGETGFKALASETEGARTVEIAPDLATCDDCLRELFDPRDRRHLYPFINCAHCGPRFTIVESLPYDRARTSMRHFPMCDTCRVEYDDPANRRFHAEPIACPDCGPRLALWDRHGDVRAAGRDALMQAAAGIRDGQIVAVKGVGGFHLMADARNEEALRRLRSRKRRPEKPLAVMFASREDVEEECFLSEKEAELLESAARPIVLLRRRAGLLAPSVAPRNPWLGALLPYAPLHHLVLRELGFPIVATSGNVSDEPIVTDEGEALARLGEIADSFVVHDRPIVRPLDDSVLRVVAGRELMLRRARGYAPAPVKVAGVAAGIASVGGHLKSTVAFTCEGAVCLSQHIGDLDTAAARIAHARALADLQRLNGGVLRRTARDQHPDYASGQDVPASAPVTEVQHHLAHVVACMAENGVAPPLLGVAFDGAGLGPDGTLWGGEFLRIEAGRWSRVAHLRAFRLPGGATAMREPRRAALGMLYEAFGAQAFEFLDLAPVASFEERERGILKAMLAKGVNAPVTTSAGRVFDAFAALSGLRQRITFDGQAAAELEGAMEDEGAPPYPFALREEAGALVVDWLPALAAALADIRKGATAGAVSARLHQGFAQATAAVAVRLNERRVALTGGCFQNARLTEATIDALRNVGCEPIWHRDVPPNDGGLALGQAVWAAWRENDGEAQCA